MALKHSALFVDVDTQFDFMDPQGALYVPRAEEILPNLQRLFAAATEDRIPIISTADCHTPNDPEFTHFPPHCVRGTPGQQRLPQTLLASRAVLEPHERVDDLAGLLDRHRQVIIHKQTIDVWTSAGARQLLEEIRADAWYVFGVATDYCVKSAALGLAKAGQPTYVVIDAVRPITPEGDRQAIAEMKAAGVRLVTTEQVIGSLRAAVSTRK